MKKTAFVVGVAALLWLGTVTIPTIAQAQPVINVQIGRPPPPHYERVPAPRRGYVWAPGHYAPRGKGHVWIGGLWMHARPGYAYRQPEWRERGGRWQQRRGGWDRDHDGVPNRHDRRPDHPHRH